VISHWYLVNHPILYQKVRSVQPATFFAAGTVSLLVIAALVLALAPAVSRATEAGFLLFTPGPVLLWTGMFLPLVLSLP
jgi:hypothetical protein